MVCPFKDWLEQRNCWPLRSDLSLFFVILLNIANVEVKMAIFYHEIERQWYQRSIQTHKSITYRTKTGSDFTWPERESKSYFSSGSRRVGYLSTNQVISLIGEIWKTFRQCNMTDRAGINILHWMINLIVFKCQMTLTYYKCFPFNQLLH